jgi:hypothetical protein
VCNLSRSQHQEEERLLENITNVLRMVDQSFGHAAVFMLMHVRNNEGHMALHLALRAGTHLQCCFATRHIQTPQTLTRTHLPLSPGLCKVAAALLLRGSPLMPSPVEQEQLRRLWKKPVDTPIRCFIGGRALSSFLSCLRTPFFSPN